MIIACARSALKVESALAVVGVKSGKVLVKELLSLMLPIYKKEDEETIKEYLEGYLEDIGDMLTRTYDSQDGGEKE